jgi:peptidyl-prolyl cis-trans isomerase B (cyclophilin B)
MIKLHTNYGVITLQLFADKAPETVANFEEYVKAGHYDNTIFHRVINNFMIQGGGFEPGMKQKATRAPIKNEANNGLSNKVGTIAMARTMEPHSASAQFFINVADNTFLDHSAPTVQGWGYAVFGEVVDGMDVVNKIKAVPTTMRAGHQDVPVDDVVIVKAEIVAE